MIDINRYYLRFTRQVSGGRVLRETELDRDGNVISERRWEMADAPTLEELEAAR